LEVRGAIVVAARKKRSKVRYRKRRAGCDKEPRATGAVYQVKIKLFLQEKGWGQAGQVARTESALVLFSSQTEVASKLSGVSERRNNNAEIPTGDGAVSVMFEVTTTTRNRVGKGMIKIAKNWRGNAVRLTIGRKEGRAGSRGCIGGGTENLRSEGSHGGRAGRISK